MGEGLEAREGFLECPTLQLTQLLPSPLGFPPLLESVGAEARCWGEPSLYFKDWVRREPRRLLGRLIRSYVLSVPPGMGLCGPPSGLFSLAVILTLSFPPAGQLAWSLEAFAMAPHWAVWLLAVELCGLGIRAEMWWNLVPRKTVSSGGE